jgi:4-hydroxy-2-oxoglutarate aldolase
VARFETSEQVSQRLHDTSPDRPERRPTALAGVFAPICTPFSDDEEIDVGALRSNLERYAATGLLGYLVLGSNGENRSLEHDEKLRVLDEVVGHRATGQLVLAGAAYDAERQAERFLAAAADHGADYGLVLSPGYFRAQMTDEVLYRYFASLADTAPLPILLYNAPGFCGITLSPELVARLAPHPRIVGMKDSAKGGIEAFLPLQSPSFSVLAGSANFLFPAMLGGSPGGTVSLANSFPEVALRLFEFGRVRDTERGRPYQALVARVNEAISGRYGVAGVKAAMDLAGFRGGIPRRPLLALDTAERDALHETLLAEGLLS